MRCVETVEILINECQRCASVSMLSTSKTAKKREGIFIYLKKMLCKNENKTNICRLMFVSWFIWAFQRVILMYQHVMWTIKIKRNSCKANKCFFFMCVLFVGINSHIISLCPMHRLLDVVEKKSIISFFGMVKMQ